MPYFLPVARRLSIVITFDIFDNPTPPMVKMIITIIAYFFMNNVYF